MREMTFVQALNEALHQAMGEDPTVFIIGENIRGGMRPETNGLDAAFAPERVLDMPISEAAFTGFANGAALAGMRPIVEFPGRLPHVPRLRPGREPGREAAPDARRAGAHSHHLLPSWGRAPGAAGPGSTPTIPIRSSSTRASRRSFPRPPRMPRGSCSPRSSRTTRWRSSSTPTCLGRRATCRREANGRRSRKGRSGAPGGMPPSARSAPLCPPPSRRAERLASDGIEVEVWDPRSLLPFDKEGLAASVAKTGRLVVADDSARTCGFAAEVAGLVAERCFDSLRSPIKRITRADVTVPYSTPIERAMLPAAGEVEAAVRALAT